MKLRALLFCGCVLLLTGAANAQFNCFLLYDCTTDPGLTYQCGFTGAPLPDGTTIAQIFWDANDNGPDAADQLARIDGPVFGRANFNSMPFNSVDDLGCEGGFYSYDLFTISTNTPQPSRYWVRVCVPGQNRYWRTNSFTITDGYSEVTFRQADWTCVEEACGGCITPDAVTNFQASDNSCSQVTMTWSPYPADQSVDSLFIYRSNTDTLVARVARAATQYVYSNAPQGSYGYIIIARSVQGNDTCFSTSRSDNGTRLPSALGPATCTASDNRCGSVIVSWTVPNNIATIDSFAIFRDGIEVGRQIRGQAGQPNSDTIFIAGTANYTVAGWNAGCGAGTQSAPDQGTAFAAPAVPANVTASVGQCLVTVNWTPSAGATGYIVYRDGNQIGTPAAPPFTHEPPTPNQNNNYTVAARNTNNPADCQTSAQSAPAVGSDIDEPLAPSNVQATDSTLCFVQVTWTDNSNNELGFIIRRGGVNIDTVAAGLQTYNDTTAAQGTSYSYTVLAYNACGNSTIPTANSGSRKQVPPQVAGVNATDNLPDRVTVTWTNTIRETNYRILRDAVQLATVAADDTTYDDMTAVPNVVYLYTVQAYNECGDGAVSVGNTGQVLASLSPPTNVQATDDLCNRVDVTWTDTQNETGYNILRDGNQIGSVAANATNFSDMTAVPGFVYAYIVQATGPGGPANSTPDNGGRAPLPQAPALVWVSSTCTGVNFSYERGDFADTTVFFLDGVQINTSVGAAGNFNVTLPDDAEHVVYAIGANECGRGDTSEQYIVSRLQAPGVVTDLTGTSENCADVLLEWTDPAGADEIHIYRNLVLIATVPFGVGEYLDNVGNGPATYEYFVRAENECDAGPTSEEIEVSVAQAPTVPTNVIASDTSCFFVWVTWDASLGDVDYYNIYRDGQLVGNSNPGVRIFSDSPPDALQHDYAVSAGSAECIDSEASDPVPGRKLESVGIPTGLVAAEARCDTLSFCWTAASGDVDGYIIYANGVPIDTVVGTCFGYLPATPGQRTYRVSAYSALCGEGGLSAPIDIQLLASPIAPPSFAGSSNSCSGVTLTWGAQPANTSLAGYRIYRGAALIFEGAAHNDDRTFVDAGASEGVNNYTIVAYSLTTGCDDSDPAATSGTVLPFPTTPTNVQASDTSCSDVYVTWTASTGTFDGYNVYRNGAFVAFVAAPATNYTDTGIAGGTTASYTVAATDDVCGTTAQSAADNGTRLEGPDAPTNVTASNNDCDEILVSWSAAPGDVTEYRVFRNGALAGTVLPPTTQFADTPPAGVYEYTVRAYSVFCGETSPSAPATGERLPQMGQVTGVTASVDSCDGILITWSAYPGATEYRVYRSDDPNNWWSSLAPHLTSVFDNSVPEGVPYSYRVTAVNPCNEGPQSAPATGQRAETPSQVTGLTATQNLVSEVCLSWNDVNGELNYNIYRNGTLIASNSADDVTYCDGTASPGVTYTYTVAATNVCGEGDLSAGAQGVAVFSLSQVTGVTASTTDCNQICLSWSDIENETGYEILRDGALLASVGANVTTYCDLTSVPGVCYNYTVRGFNIGGAGPESVIVQGCRRNIPAQVQGLTATTTNCSMVILNWTDTADEDRYDVYRNGVLLVQNVPANTTTYNDNTATPGVAYMYTILAVNACGNAPQSAPAQGAVATVPPLVAGLTASNNICSQIALTWQDQLSETGYLVYRDGNLTTPIATVPANQTNYTDTGVTGVHTYNVRAINNCGNGEAGSAVAGEGLTVPGVATAVAAVENCGNVTVTWNAPATQPIQEYRVLRNGSQIATVPVGTTMYMDANVAAGTYSYRIVTANQCGAGAQSALSNSVTVIPNLVQVTGFTAVPSNCFCINLNWSNVANESGYYIYCNGVIVDTVGANVTTLTYCPADTQTCSVQVAAFNSCQIGPLSSAIVVTPNTYPPAISGFTASENLCDRVLLQWTAYSHSGVSLLKIRRNGANVANVPAGTTSYNQLGVWPQSTYSISALRVCAPGDTIESPLATDGGRTAPTPIGPSQMAASDDGCGIVTVTFTFTDVDGQDSVHVKRNGNVIARLAGGLPNVQRSYVDASPLPAVAVYEVCALSNICGQGGCANDVGQAAPVAGAVTNLAATNDRCNTIILTWTGTQYATQYVVRRNGAVLANVPQGTFVYSDNVPTGTTNSYTVAATNDCGSGPQTPPVTGSTIPLPAVPTGVAASDGLCNQVIVSWNLVATATSYQVWRNNTLLADNIPGAFNSYTDNSVQPGVTYNYQVRGVNQCGLGVLSAPTTGFSAQQVATVTNITATVNLNDRVRLTWNNVAQETGYEILRGFPPQSIATVSADVTSYNDFSAAPGVEYEYRVRAFNNCGIGEMSTVVYGYRVPVDPIIFGVVTVTTELYGCMSAVPADMDGDGDMDVVAAGMFADKVMWYENNGTWDYTPHVVIADWDGARSVAVGDLDGDGDLDIAAVAQFANELMWFRKNANGTFTPNIIRTNYRGARDVIIVDMDGDGDRDLVTAACDDNDVSWWRNNGSGVFTRFVVDNNFVGARSIEVADIGNDGDKDILGAAYEGGMLAWWSNNGSQSFTRHVLATGWFGASYINAAHLNNDNVLDIYFCVAQQPMIAWWDGATMEQNYITSLLPFPRELDAVDMDDDGRADLLVAANEPNEISWWRNTDNRFYRNVMSSSFTQASVVKGADFDGDQDTDVLGAGEGTIKIWLSSLLDVVEGASIIRPQDDDNEGGDRPAFGHVAIPLVHELSANYPNPFNPTTQIRFGLPEADYVKLTVYDITGREVARLAEGSFGAGYHTVTFDASQFASGVYLYRMEAGSFVQSRKMVLMK